MHQQQLDIDEIYLAALEVPAGGEREAYLDKACAANRQFRERVERLLRAQPEVGSFLESAAVPDLANFAPMITGPDIAEVAGMQIGPYKLLEQIGEGGFGVVFMAEQQQPVRRKVALKVLKPGMDTRQVVARFEAERQALALMDHPHIAKVLDAGATESGRPFFVMELVKGVAITEYCDAKRLRPRERLELFVAVCQAVQHAHQKGIIHRDIKPSNVLVTKHDGAPVVKVIDFGVAKALVQQLTDKTLFTGFAQMIGTPLYMSPEQADFSGLDVDTRTDVYSLGVLLYELLTGTTPFAKERLRSAAFDEIRRIIREDEPPKPSTRLSELSRPDLSGKTEDDSSRAAAPTRPLRQTGPTSLASVAALRQTEPRKLSQLVRGDLDWIVMKALEKDRNRRYETASSFALDIQRYLADEPVEACPPSAVYLFRKFARRNRGVILVTSLFITGLVVAVVMLGVSNALIRNEQARTREERTRAQAAQQIAEHRADQLRQGVLDLQSAHRLLERGRFLVEKERWDDAQKAFTSAIEQRPEYAGPWDARADLYIRLGLFDLALYDLDRAYELQEPVSHRWMCLALLRFQAGDVVGAREASSRMRLHIREAGTLDFTRDAVRVALFLPDGDADPLELVEQAQSLSTAEPGNAFLRYLLGLAQYRAGRFEQASAELQAALTVAPDWEPRRIALPVQAMALHQLGREDDARSALTEAGRTIDDWTGQIGRSNQGNWAIHQGVGNWPVYWWDWVECQLRFREASLLINASPPAEDPRLHVLRARAFAGLRWTRKAIEEYDAATAGLPDDRQIQCERARARGYFYGYRDWAQAARDFAEARRLMPDQAGTWNLEAVSHLAAGNRSAYQQVCRLMLARFSATRDALAAVDVVDACILEPKAVPDPADLLPLAQVAARLPEGGMRVVGAVCYRAGQYAEAIRQLEESARLVMPRSWEWCFLAMAHHHLGHAAQARQCLESAARWIAEADERTFTDSQYQRQEWAGFVERFEFPLLYAEASALINSEQRPVGER